MNILIVDDIESNLFTLEALLDTLKDGYTNKLNIIKALNGNDALMFCLNQTIDLIILDVQMPEMDGYEVAKLLKSTNETKAIPIIFLTATFKFTEFTKRGFEVGAIDYFTKPIDEYQFLNKIKMYIQLFQQQKDLKKQAQEQKVLLSLFDIGDTVLFNWNNDDALSVKSVSLNVINLLKYTQEELSAGKCSYKFCIYKDDVEMVITELIEASNSDTQFLKHSPYRIVDKNNDLRWVLDYTTIVRDKNNTITNYLGVVSDITELKIKDQQIMQQSKLAQMGEMLNMIAHQWRQPLNAMSASAINIEILQELQSLDDTKITQHADFIQSATQEMSNTIDDFMNFFRPEEKKIDFKFIKIIESIYSILGSQLKAKGIQLIYDTKSNIILHSYKNELSHILINLISNARDAYENKDTCDSSIASHCIENKTIEILCIQKNQQTIIQVIDKAGGIPKEIIDKVFNPYFTTKEQGKGIGIGIGLYMTKRIVKEIFHGNIKVKNEDKGAIFTLTFVKDMDFFG